MSVGDVLQPEGAGNCLHLVVGAGREALEDCLLHSAARDSILFLDAGVLHLLQEGNAPVVGLAQAFFAEADLQAHGLLALARQMHLRRVDDAGFWSLVASHEHCLTWT